MNDLTYIIESARLTADEYESVNEPLIEAWDDGRVFTTDDLRTLADVAESCRELRADLERALVVAEKAVQETEHAIRALNDIQDQVDQEPETMVRSIHQILTSYSVLHGRGLPEDTLLSIEEVIRQRYFNLEDSEESS